MLTCKLVPDLNLAPRLTDLVMRVMYADRPLKAPQAFVYFPIKRSKERCPPSQSFMSCAFGYALNCLLLNQILCLTALEFRGQLTLQFEVSDTGLVMAVILHVVAFFHLQFLRSFSLVRMHATEEDGILDGTFKDWPGKFRPDVESLAPGVSISIPIDGT